MYPGMTDPRPASDLTLSLMSVMEYKPILQSSQSTYACKGGPGIQADSVKYPARYKACSPPSDTSGTWCGKWVLAALQIVGLMKVPPSTEDDKAGKAALFTKYVEGLPHALDSWKDTGLGLVSRLLLGIQKVVQHNTTLHQNLFRSVPGPHACCRCCIKQGHGCSSCTSCRSVCQLCA